MTPQDNLLAKLFKRAVNATITNCDAPVCYYYKQRYQNDFIAKGLTCHWCKKQHHNKKFNFCDQCRDEFIEYIPQGRNGYYTALYSDGGFIESKYFTVPLKRQKSQNPYHQLVKIQRWIRKLLHININIQIASDIHLEHHPATVNFEKLLPKLPSAKYLILAGDICQITQYQSRFTNFMEYCSNNWSQIYYVCGNHEFYGGEIADIFISIQRLLKPFKNIHLLEKSYRYIEELDLYIYGTTMWSKTEKNPGLNDYSRIRYQNRLITHKDTLGWFNQTSSWLEQQLKKDHGDSRVMVITHHLPSMQLIAPKYRVFHTMNIGFASDLDHLVEKADYWVCGHTHTPMTKNIRKCKVIINPHGYPGENPVYKPFLLPIPQK